MSVLDPTSNEQRSVRSLPTTNQQTLRRTVVAFLSTMAIAAAVWAASSSQLRSEELAKTSAILIVVATYFVMAVGELPGFYLDRAGAALLGASLMVATGLC
jgi:hypothetical protein